MKPQPLLQVDKLSSGYGPIQALKGVSLEIHPGEIVALIGANGAGKTTLLMTLFGEPRRHAGRVLLDGQDISALPTARIARMGLSLVPEGRRIFPAMTVRENLEMGLLPLRPEPPTDPERALRDLFELFPVLRERQQQRAGTLSGGEQQMLAIGRALMGKPVLLMLDEPSLGLAPLVCRQIFGILQEIAATGTTIFLVEQNAFQALRLAHRGYVLANGEVRLSGTGRELLHNPEVERAYLGGHET
ncbi:MAG: ABC transporter ATP-binding protein [Magnetococcales bacterium]|nr:ABC transporter ATP-binding protein [Magnetococcales bacterium]